MHRPSNAARLSPRAARARGSFGQQIWRDRYILPGHPDISRLPFTYLERELSMRKLSIAVALAACLPLALAVMAAPIRAAGSQPGWRQISDGRSGPLGTHATRGVVVTIDANTMVITRPGKRGIMTFSLSSSTHREGVIAVDCAVSVRYREDGKTHVATAIALQRSKE